MPTATDASDATDLIRLDTRSGVATLTLDRPAKHNAMSGAMWTALADHCTTLATRADVRVVVVTGAGDSFCAGADINELQRDDERTKLDVVQAEHALRALPVPTIAAIHGNCRGGGVQIALACDIRIATPDASFAVPPARLAVIYPATSTRNLVALVGPATAKRLLFTAEVLSATAALRAGLVDDVVEDLDAAVGDLTDRLGAQSLLSQAAAKDLVNDVVDGIDPASRYEDWMRVWARSADSSEGPAAFLAKRTPQFTWHPADLGRPGR